MFDPTVSGLYGNQQEFDGASLDYSYWNAGLTLTVDHLAFDFRYWDTDISSVDMPRQSSQLLRLALRGQRDPLAAITNSQYRMHPVGAEQSAPICFSSTR